MYYIKYIRFEKRVCLIDVTFFIFLLFITFSGIMLLYYCN